MIKKLFDFKARSNKNKIVNALNKSMPISNDEIFKWTSGRNKTIQAFPIELIINHETNAKLIKEIKMATGMAGSHNKDKAEIMLMRPIRQLVNMIHLLPASEFEHFNHPGGLFTLCLEASLRSIHCANRKILTRITPEIRRENEDLWTYAAFLNGLFSEAIATISNLTVIDENNVTKWQPTKEPVTQWLYRNNHQHYYILNPCSFRFKGWPPHFQRVFLKKPTIHRNLNVVHQAVSLKNQPLLSHCRHCWPKNLPPRQANLFSVRRINL